MKFKIQELTEIVYFDEYFNLPHEQREQLEQALEEELKQFNTGKYSYWPKLKFAFKTKNEKLNSVLIVINVEIKKENGKFDLIFYHNNRYGNQMNIRHTHVTKETIDSTDKIVSLLVSKCSETLKSLNRLLG